MADNTNIIYVIAFVYLCFVARLAIFHLFNDFGESRKGKAKLKLDLDDDALKRLDRSIKAMGLLVTLFWPAMFIARPVLFLKMYCLADRIAMMKMFMFYGYLARKLTLQ